jgi:hypothetical protein
VKAHAVQQTAEAMEYQNQPLLNVWRIARATPAKAEGCCSITLVSEIAIRH